MPSSPQATASSSARAAAPALSVHSLPEPLEKWAWPSPEAVETCYLIPQRLAAVDIELGKAPAAHLIGIGPYGLERARHIERKKAQLAVGGRADVVWLVFGKIDKA